MHLPWTNIPPIRGKPSTSRAGPPAACHITSRLLIVFAVLRPTRPADRPANARRRNSYRLATPAFANTLATWVLIVSEDLAPAGDLGVTQSPLTPSHRVLGRAETEQPLQSRSRNVARNIRVDAIDQRAFKQPSKSLRVVTQRTDFYQDVILHWRAGLTATLPAVPPRPPRFAAAVRNARNSAWRRLWHPWLGDHSDTGRSPLPSFIAARDRLATTI